MLQKSRYHIMVNELDQKKSWQVICPNLSINYLYQSKLNHKYCKYKALKMQKKYFQTENWNFEVSGIEKCRAMQNETHSNSYSFQTKLPY